MWSLYKAAHELYQSEVVSSGKLFHRYKDDFLNSHSYPTSFNPVSMNEHQKNIGIMEELLENRRDLVDKYFANPVFTYADYTEMQHELDTAEVSCPVPAKTSPKKEVVHALNFESCMTDTQVHLLVKLFEKHGIFKTKVEFPDVVALLSCTLSTPLVPTHNTKLAYLFNMLSVHNLICTKWQNVIGMIGIICTSSGNHLTNSNLSSALQQANKSEKSEYVSIKNDVIQIAESR